MESLKKMTEEMAIMCCKALSLEIETGEISSDDYQLAKGLLITALNYLEHCKQVGKN